MKTKVNDLSAKDYSIGDYLKESKKFLIPRREVTPGKRKI